MKKVNINLDSIEKVREFVDTISKFKADFDITSGTKDIDAKSILGFLTLDLSKPMNLTIHDSDETDQILEAIKPFTVE
jgi:phosphotransferase system HPr-like phosphotransfer protein